VEDTYISKALKNFMPPNRVGRRIPPIQTFFWIALEPKTLQLPINSFMQAIQNLQPESMNGLLHFVGPRKYGGRDWVRTCDPLLAKQMGHNLNAFSGVAYEHSDAS